jgi:4-amino-4-deoxy-L-arabinose transferase-like glycosyltransferase
VEKRAGEAKGALPTQGIREEVPERCHDRPASADRTRRWLVAILASGCAIRLAHFWAISDTAFLKAPLAAPASNSDLYAFWQWAQTIAAGDLLGRNTYHPDFLTSVAPMETWYRWWGGKEIFRQAPLYPYWVAGLSAVSSSSVGFVIFAQLAAGALQPLVIFWLAKRLLDARVGLVAAALTAFYGPFIFHQGVLLRDWLPPLLEPLALVALLTARARGRRLDWLLAGVTLGVAVLTKETILLFIPLVLLWLVLEYRGVFKTAAIPAAILILGFLLALSPLLFRNYAVGAPLFAISNQAGEAFIVGNAADGFPVGFVPPASLIGILTRSDGRLGTIIRETLATYQGDWIGFVARQFLKLRALVDPLEVPNNVSFSYGLEISPALWFTLRYGIIFPLGVAGLCLSLRQWRRHLLLALYALSSVGGMMFGVILARFRLVLVPPLMIYGAAGLVSFVEAIRMRRMGKVRVYVGLIVGFTVTQHLLLPLWNLRGTDYYGIHSYDYFVSAEIYAGDGRPDRAVTEMERLQRKASERASFASVGTGARFREGNYRVQWATKLIAEGRREEAGQQAESARLAYTPFNDRSDPHLTLGILYLKLAEPATAMGFLERFLELEPAGSRADAVRRTLDRLQRGSE